jgi:tetratricopeptide (TPR) repeat protein
MINQKIVVLLACSWALAISSVTGHGSTALAQQKPPATSSRTTPDFAALSDAAEKARQEGRNDDAIRLYRQGLSVQPDWKQGLWFLGMLLYEKEQYAEVRDLMRRFVAVEPLAGPGWALLGLSEFQTREYPRSLEHLQHVRAIGLGKQQEMSEALFYHVSVLLTRFEQYDAAMTLLMGLRKSGSSPDLLVEPIGLSALRYPLLPSEIPPARKEMFRLAGEAALADESNRRDEAEKLFSAMAAEFPNEPGVHFLFGVFLLDVRPDDGIREIQRELVIVPYNLTAKLRLADEYLKEEKFDDALRLASEVVQLDPQNPSGFMVLGEALVAKNDLDRGIAALETSRKLRPETVRTHWDLLRAYTSAGRAKDAKREKEEIEQILHPVASQ